MSSSPDISSFKFIGSLIDKKTRSYIVVTLSDSCVWMYRTNEKSRITSTSSYNLLNRVYHQSIACFEFFGHSKITATVTKKKKTLSKQPTKFLRLRDPNI